MIEVLPLNEDLEKYLKKSRLKKQWEKAHFFITSDIRHPGLNVELLEPKERKIYSFRLNKKYRGLFLFQFPNVIEIIAFTKHYQ